MIISSFSDIGFSYLQLEMYTRTSFWRLLEIGPIVKKIRKKSKIGIGFLIIHITLPTGTEFFSLKHIKADRHRKRVKGKTCQSNTSLKWLSNATVPKANCENFLLTLDENSLKIGRH